MKQLLIIVSLLLFIACGKSGTETRYYPAGENPPSEDVVEIDLDTVGVNVREIIRQIGSIQNRGETPVIQFFDDGVLKRIIPVLTSVDRIPAENKLIIRSESLIREQAFPGNRLKPVLRQHYVAVSGDRGSPDQAIIVVAVDPERTAVELRHVLRNLTRTFDEVDQEVEEDLNLHILFDYFSPTPAPPPPPPPPVEN